MPTLGYFVCCQNPIVNRLTNSLTLVDIITHLVAHPYKTPDDASDEVKEAQKDIIGVLQPFAACAQWFKLEDEPSDIEFTQRLTIVAPDEREGEHPGEQSFVFGTPLHGTIQITGPIGIRMPGMYQIRLHLQAPDKGEWQWVGTFPFLVFTHEQATATVEQQQAEAPEGTAPDS